MPFDSKSYIGQLFSAMKLGLTGDEQRGCTHLQTAKKLRNFVVAWCHFWSHTMPPFISLGNKKDSASSGSSCLCTSWSSTQKATKVSLLLCMLLLSHRFVTLCYTYKHWQNQSRGDWLMMMSLFCRDKNQPKAIY